MTCRRSRSPSRIGAWASHKICFPGCLNCSDMTSCSWTSACLAYTDTKRVGEFDDSGLGGGPPIRAFMVCGGGGVVIGVTGATGQIGGRVARLLAEAGLPQRLVVRDLSRAPTLEGADVVLAGSYADGHAARRALEGVNVLLMISAQESADRLTHHLTFIDAAAAAGV